jgi:hypothetical protein
LRALAGLKQLTQLYVSPIISAQLQYLPAQVRELHLTVLLNAPSQQCTFLEATEQLAGWLQRRIMTVRSLEVVGPCFASSADWQQANAALDAAFHAASSALVAAAGTVHEAAQAPSSMQLESFSISWDPKAATPGSPCFGLQGVLQHMPASTLTQLTCTAEWQHVLPPYFDLAVVAADCAAVCGLSNLRSLTLTHRLRSNRWDELGPLTVLQQLTQLQLESVGSHQLRQLEMSQLLYVGLDSSPAQLQLRHLTSVSRLWVQDRVGVLQAGDQLQPNLVDLWWYSEPMDEWSLQPLLRLSCLRQLQLRFSMMVNVNQPSRAASAAAELARLSSLSRLRQLELTYDWHHYAADVQQLIAAVSAVAEPLAAAWQVLPLTSLAWRFKCTPIAVLQQGMLLQGLSSLQLVSAAWIRWQPELVAPAAVMSLLQRATALQQLHLECQLDCSTLRAPGVVSWVVATMGSWVRAPGVSQGLGGGQLGAADAGPAGGILHLLRAVWSFPELEVACVKLGVQLSDEVVGQLSGMIQQQVPDMQQYCLVKPSRVTLEF